MEEEQIRVNCDLSPFWDYGLELGLDVCTSSEEGCCQASYELGLGESAHI
jgi:hypothetical protein